MPYFWTALAIMRMRPGIGIASRFRPAGRRKRVPSGIAVVELVRPSVRWAGHEKTPARVSGMATASAWLIVPDWISEIRIRPPRNGRLVAVAPQRGFGSVK